MKAGLIAGSVAAIVAALVSLPLRSPIDSIFNSATVVVGVLVVGLAAGILWKALVKGQRGTLYYAAALGGGLMAVTLLALVVETQVDRAVSFSVPLAAIAFLVAGALVPIVDRSSVSTWRWSTPAAVLIALGVGVGLIGQGDAESGSLELPPRPSLVALSPPESLAAPAGTVSAQGSRGTLKPTPAPTVSPTPESADIVTSGPAPTVTPTRTPAPSPTPTPSFDTERKIGSYEGVTFIVTDGSQATFTVTEQLVRLSLPNDAVMRTTALSGEIHLDGRPSAIDVNLHRLKSDNSFRDGYVRNRMFPSDPIARFVVDDVGSVAEAFTQGEPTALVVGGRLKIRGIEVLLNFDIEARDDGDVIHILGRTTFEWADFQISKPRARPVVSVEDEVRVEVLLEVRPVLDQRLGVAGPDSGSAAKPPPSEGCIITPSDQQGPFYREGAPFRTSLASPGSTGVPLRVSGTVYLQGCARTLGGAVVDVWHTDSSGEYDFSDNLYFRGRVTADESGRYSFETVMPAAYEPRPAHIHVKISHGDWGTLTTQIYFDRTDARVPEALLISLKESESGGEVRQGVFNFVIAE